MIGTQPLSCLALSNLKSGREELYSVYLMYFVSYSQIILHTFPDIKQHWHFQRVTDKQQHTLFQSLYQAILTFPESSFQIRL